MVGAEILYQDGYTGTGLLLGNVEAGHAYNTHQTLDDGRIEYLLNWEADTTTTHTNHATQTGGVMIADGILNNGSDTPTGPGIATDGTMWSGQIGTTINSDGTFSISDNSLLYPLMAMGDIGIDSGGTVGGSVGTLRTVDVINSSWGAGDNTGNTIINVIYDYLAVHHGTTMVVSAGNSGQGAGTVGTPANSWNTIAVGATNEDGTAVASFSSGGPTGSFDETDTRIKPDIVAPGTNILMPTGDDGSFAYSNGTSFSGPIVAASAGLMIEYGKHTGRSTDPRTIKAVLLNSADKLSGWEQQVDNHPDSGARINSTPLDPAQGAGMLNLETAYRQYEADGGNGHGAGAVAVETHKTNYGWDINSVSAGAPNDYFFNQKLAGGSEFSATLAWFMDRVVEGYDHTSNDPSTDTSFLNYNFDDLDLLLYQADKDGNFLDLVAASISGWDIANPDAAGTGWDSIEHLSLSVPTTGYYGLRVDWQQEMFFLSGDGQNDETYSLAWYATAIPEPTTALLILFAATFLYRRPKQPTR